MDEIALPFEESVDVIGEIARNLRHPQSIRCASDSANLDPPRRQLHKEKDDEPLQAARRPDFYCKEVTGHDLIPMSAEELLPSYLPASFRSRLDAMSFQDVRNRVVCQWCDPDWQVLPVSVDIPKLDSLLPSAQPAPRFP